MDLLPNVRDEALTRVVYGISALLASAETIKHEEENFQRISAFMIHAKEIRSKLQLQQGTVAGRETTCRVLQKMEEEVDKAREAIDEYKSKSRLLRPFCYRSVLSRLNRFSKMTDALQALLLPQISEALDISASVDSMIHRMESMNRKLASNSDPILSMIDVCVCGDSSSLYRRSKGAASSSVCPYPIHERGKELVGVSQEEPEGAGPDYFSNHLQRSGGIKISSPRPSTDEIEIPPNPFFLCHLTGEIIEDPVSVICDHSFERTAIENYFSAGNNLCPLCGRELSFMGKMDLISNSTLLDSISEWKQRNEQIRVKMNAKKKFIEAAARVTPNNSESTNQALEDLQTLMVEVPSCINEATGSSCKVVSKIAELLKDPSSKTPPAAFTCLRLIAAFSDQNKEVIGRGGVIKCLLKESMRDPNAVELLLELSKIRTVAGKIGGTAYSITILVSLLDDPSSDVAEMARRILENLSFDANSTVMMAKSGYFTPLLELFNFPETSEETRAFIAEELSQMQLMETGARSLENEISIDLLTEMLRSGSPSSILASLKCIKQLISFESPRNRFLQNEFFFPALSRLITSKAFERKPQQEASEIAISLMESTQAQEIQANPAFQTLFSRSSLQDMLEKIKTSSHEDQLMLLHLLLIIVQKSDSALKCIASDHYLLSCLFSAINVNQHSAVKLSVLKLIYYYIARDHSVEVLLPPSPAKESFFSSIITILSESFMDEELSAALGIISHLPLCDQTINEMLQTPALLKSIIGFISPASNLHACLSEDALGALQRCMHLSSSEFQKQVCKLAGIDLVRILFAGSSSAKQRAAMILTHLSLCTLDSPPVSSPSRSEQLGRRIANMVRPSKEGNACALHGTSCSLQRLICLAAVGAVKPLVEMLKITEPGAPEAALMALDSLFDTGCDLNSASAAILESSGAAPILDLLERGEMPVKERALELFRKIFKHPGVTQMELARFRGLLLNTLRRDDGLKQKAQVLLKFWFENSMSEA